MKVILATVTGSLLAVSLNYAIAAEKLELPKFESVAEVIGWLKAKGKCAVGADKKERCFHTIRLPSEPDMSDKGSKAGLWDIEARLQSLGDGLLDVTISRKRRVALSTKDSSAYVVTTTESEYSYLPNGKFADVMVGFRVSNSAGETILNYEVPTEPFKHRYWISDDLVLERLGFAWRPRPAN